MNSADRVRALFEWDETGYRLSSGEFSDFRINAEVLEPAVLAALANYAHARIRPYGRVEGVPTGGILLATFMSARTSQRSTGLLIVDDVWTTGRQMEEQRSGREAQGLVIFARRRPAPWVKAIWLMEDRCSTKG